MHKSLLVFSSSGYVKAARPNMKHKFSLLCVCFYSKSVLLMIAYIASVVLCLGKSGFSKEGLQPAGFSLLTLHFFSPSKT